MPFIPGAGPIPAPPINFGPGRMGNAAEFDAVMDRFAPAQAITGQEFPDIIPPATSLDSSPIGRTIGVGPMGPTAVSEPGKLFKPLADFLGEVNSTVMHSGELQMRFAAGENVELHDVMIASEKAGVATSLTMHLRNKLLEAYQEISRMQV